MLVEVEKIVEFLESQHGAEVSALDLAARYYLLIGRSDKASQRWSSVLSSQPDEPYALNALGIVSQREGNIEAAIDFFGRALKSKPDAPQVRLSLAKALMQNGELELAKNEMLTCLKLHPTLAEGWQVLGQLHLSLGELEQALQSYSKILERDPRNYLAQQGLGSALLRLGKTEEAKKWMSSQHTERQSQGELTVYTGEKERDQLADFLLLVANFFSERNDSQTTIRILRFSQGCFSEHLRTTQALFRILRAKKMDDQALTLVKDLSIQHPQRGFYHVLLAEVYAAHFAWKQADESMVKVAELEPNDADALTRVANYFLRRDTEPQLLDKVVAKTVELRGSAADFALLAQVQDLRGDRLSAKRALRRAIDLAPQETRYREILERLEGLP